MARTRFIPQLDGLLVAAVPTGNDSVAHIQTLHGQYQDALQPTIEALQPFLGASFAFTAFQEMDALLQASAQAFTTAATQAVAPLLGWDQALLFTLLDYYYAGVPVPRAAFTTSGKHEEVSHTLAHYIQHRDGDANRAHNIATQLMWLSVVRGIAAPGPVDVSLEIPLHDFSNSAVHSTVDVHVTRPGLDVQGWRVKTLTEQWNDLRRHLDAGGPWPLALVTAGSNPYDAPHRIAYDYHVQDESTVHLLVFDPHRPNEGRMLTMSVDDGVLSEGKAPDSALLSEHNGHYQAVTPDILGFYTLAYTPAFPPTSRTFRALRWLMRRRWIWRLTRWFRWRRLRRRLAYHASEKT